MDEADEEDVVFEGSAIHQHLLDTGYTDFEPSPYMSSASQQDTSQESGIGSCENTFSLEVVRQRWIGLPSSLWGNLVKLVQYYIYTSVAVAAYRSRVINEDDWMVLEHFLPGGEELHVSGSITFSLWNIMTYKIFLLPVISILLFWVATDDWPFYAVLVFTVLMIDALYCIYSVLNAFRMNQFVASMKETCYLASKTVRLLKEMDLIAKGFVLAQGPGASSISVYEESPQSINLCDTLSRTLNSATYSLLSVHKLLEHRVPQYPTIRHLFEESPPHEKGCSLSEQIQYLKSRVTVLRLQASAVLTELLLWLDRSEELYEYKSVVDYIATVHKKSDLYEKTLSLKKQYEYNRCFWLTERPDTSDSQSVEDKKKNVYLAIHSLALHLQAALFRVQNLEAKFDIENDFSGTSQIDCDEGLPTYDYVKGQLSALKLELDSCRGCMEETEVRAERKYGVSDGGTLSGANTSDSTSEDGNINLAMVREQPTILLYDEEVPAAEDEVFEAYVDQDYVAEDRGGPEDDLWSVDARKEKQRLRKQKEQGKRVLKELQPILTTRRKMWEEREKIALEKRSCKEKQDYSVNKMEGKENTEESSVKERRTIDDQRADGPTDSGEIYAKALLSCGSEASYNQGKQVESVHSENTADLEKEVDSDEERLIEYRKIREELDKELDSDEERLRTYRKVKEELDKDEQRRVMNEARTEKAQLLSRRCLGHFQGIFDKKKAFNSEDSDTEDEDASKVLGLKASTRRRYPQKQQSGLERSIGDMSEPLDLKDELGKSCTVTLDPGLGNVNSERYFPCTGIFTDSGRESEVKPRKSQSSVEIMKGKEETYMHNVGEESHFPHDKTFADSGRESEFRSEKSESNKEIAKVEEETFMYNAEIFMNPCEKSEVKSRKPESREENRKQEEEIFTCNEDTDSDMSPHINWSTFTFPMHQTDTLNDRLHLYSGGCGVSFQAEVAAEAVKASKKFCTLKELQEETFHGMGEGEVVFGDDSEEEEGCDQK